MVVPLLHSLKNAAWLAACGSNGADYVDLLCFLVVSRPEQMVGE
jgi:hypothetical protein